MTCKCKWRYCRQLAESSSWWAKFWEMKLCFCFQPPCMVMSLLPKNIAGQMLFNLNTAFWNDERASLECTMVLFNSCPTVWNTWALKVHAYFQIMGGEKHQKNLIWLRSCLWEGLMFQGASLNQQVDFVFEPSVFFFKAFWPLSLSLS